MAVTLPTVRRLSTGFLKRFHSKRTADPFSAIVPVTWRWRVSVFLAQLAADLVASEPSKGQQGVLLRFELKGSELGHPVYHVFSVRGNIHMGVISWSNQWRRPKFTPVVSAVFDQRCIGEIYAGMKLV